MKKMSDMYRGLGAFGTIGMEIALGFVVALFGGGWLDRRFDVAPWCTVVLFLLATASSVKAIRRGIVMMREVSEREEREEGNPKPLWDSDPPSKRGSDTHASEKPGSNEATPHDDEKERDK